MIPFIPHLAFECLEQLNCKSITNWPEIQDDALEETKIAIQVNGKTRDIILIKKDLSEKNVDKIVKDKSKAKKFIENKKIVKTIFVKNRIVNYIIAKE